MTFEQFPVSGNVPEQDHEQHSPHPTDAAERAPEVAIEALDDQLYRTELLPLIEVLQPDGVSAEEHERLTADELFASVKVLQTRAGKLIASPEETIADAKTLLLSRLMAAVHPEKETGPNNQSEFVSRAQAALLLSGVPHSKLREYIHNSSISGEEKIGEYTKPLFEKYIRAGDMTMVTKLLDNLDVTRRGSGGRSIYWAYTPQYGGGSWADKEQRLILTGKMPYWVFDRARYSFEEDEVAKNLIPRVHYERVFIKRLLDDVGGLNQLGMFLESRADTEFENRLITLEKELAGVQNGDSMHANEFHEIAEILKKKIIHNFQLVNEGSRLKGFYAICTKQDFEEIFASGVDIDEIDPSDLPVNLESSVKQYLIEKWLGKMEKTKDVWAGRYSTSIRDATRFFSIDILEEAIQRGIPFEPDHFYYGTLKSLGERAYILFPAFRTLSEDERRTFLRNCSETSAFEMTAMSDFDEQFNNRFITEFHAKSREEIEKYARIKIGVHMAMRGMVEGHDTSLITDKSLRDETFENIRAIADTQKDINLVEATQKNKNIQEAFRILDDQERLSEEIRSITKSFEERFGAKGKHLIALAIVAYGVENPESFVRKMKQAEIVLGKYQHQEIPSGAHVSLGIEYEVTPSIAETYKADSLLSYRADIELVSRAANIGRGTGGVHEIATKPTYNPYLLLAEMRLLQDAGFIDFNFERYPKAPRGYHLSLVGEKGLYVDNDAYFLHNVMTMAQLGGVIGGKGVERTKDIHKKNFELFENSKQQGERVEIKGMACDSVEQFEKAILTAHHAGIAIQLAHTHVPNASFETIPPTPEEFEVLVRKAGMLAKKFPSSRERDMVYAWMKLKTDMVRAVEQHNASFIDSEFNGFMFDAEGNYIDTGEHIDTLRNRSLVGDETLQSEIFKRDVALYPDDLFRMQTTRMVNGLARINNIFLKRPERGVGTVNARAVLDVAKREGYGEILDGDPRQSIFDRNGEFRDGYYVIQGASEEMISHKSQILLNRFNRTMDRLLSGSATVSHERSVRSQAIPV